MDAFEYLPKLGCALCGVHLFYVGWRAWDRFSAIHAHDARSTVAYANGKPLSRRAARWVPSARARLVVLGMYCLPGALASLCGLVALFSIPFLPGFPDEPLWVLHVGFIISALVILALCGSVRHAFAQGEAAHPMTWKALGCLCVLNGLWLLPTAWLSCVLLSFAIPFIQVLATTIILFGIASWRVGAEIRKAGNVRVPEDDIPQKAPRTRARSA